ncbi:hypothetical protein K443DRAFT_123378 [Laccaria amethystina LaAM-08-1]|uniref:BHLH domain-containing protein n=1 Tax=Laccaria amethystina LaAM-08-1 TaxID=1095629 RepID=A0A0C9WNG5_9AGAR|nr:hypothetical protein K443DRAFT_123378 [Laccaria amethystina LaAM-08-1]
MNHSPSLRTPPQSLRTTFDNQLACYSQSPKLRVTVNKQAALPISYSHSSFPKASHSPPPTTSLNQNLQFFLFFIGSVNLSSINPTHIVLPSSQALYPSSFHRVIQGSGIGIPDSEDGTVIDDIDERGFVDGVKVARKCSKANVLGNAIEYIRVLKKRENRLKAEQAGLKTLRFGGEEKDEVEGDDLEGDDEESDEEDGDEGDEELRRKRKRPKFPGVSKKALAERKTSTPATGGDSGVPEKRKRGRPRKVVPLPATAATVASPLAPLPQTQPLNAVLGCLLVKRVKQHLGELFIDSVYGRKSEKDDEESTKQKEGEMRRTIDAARELSGQVEELGRVLEKVWKTSCAALDHITVDLNLDKEVDVSQTQDSVDTQINALLSALVLYRLGGVLVGSVESPSSSDVEVGE